MASRIPSAANTVLLLVVLAGCSSPTAPPPPPPPPAAPVLSAVAGDNQNAVAGLAVAVKPAVKVANASGQGVSGVLVIFAVASGGGSIQGAAGQTTGADGLATVGGWVLGTTAGANTLTATASGTTVSGGGPLTFTATGVAGPPAVIAKQAGDI